MKRILFFVAVAAIVIGCKKECPECPKCPEGPQTSSTATHPTDTIVVDYSKVDVNWAIENSDYILGRNTNGNILVALSLINENNEQTARAYWLSTNGVKIHFDESSKYILAAHTIPSSATIRPGKGKASISYGEIKSKINDFEIPNVGSDPNRFNNDKYNHYAAISIVDSAVKIDLIDDFDPDVTCYSIPFLRSIANMSNVDDNTQFEFSDGLLNPGPDEKNIIYFQTGTGSRYMDYSHIPTKNKIAQ